MGVESFGVKPSRYMQPVCFEEVVVETKGRAASQRITDNVAVSEQEPPSVP